MKSKLITKNTNFAVLNGVVYIGEELETMPKYELPEVTGTIFNDKKMESNKSTNDSYFDLVGARLGWINSEMISVDLYRFVKTVHYLSEPDYSRATYPKSN